MNKINLKKVKTRQQNKNKESINSTNCHKNENVKKNKKDGELGKNLRIYSYNSRGFDEIKQKFCMEMLNITEETVPILCNQENFVLKGNNHLIRKALDNMHVVIKPASKIRFEGRPVNGMFIAFPAKFRSKVKDVSPEHTRVQAVLLESHDNVMIVNVYLPSDPKTIKYQADEELEDVLSVIENLIESHQCSNVVLVGDFNCDYARANGRVDRIKRFLLSNSLETACDSFKIDYTHEFENNNITYTSTIDHIVWNKKLKAKVIECDVIHSIHNTSDHSPIYCEINIKLNSEKDSQEESTKNKDFKIKTLNDDDWQKFHDVLDANLKNIDIPKCCECRNINCNESEHKKQLDSYVENVLKVIDKCILSTAKSKGNKQKITKVIPGWNDVVRPFNENANFWSAVWKSAGKPLNNELHKIMKRTRNIYHYAIRKCKRATEYIKKEKLLNSCISGQNNVFDEIRKMRRTGDNIPVKIDGCDKPAERFGEVYKELYNSAGDSVEMNKLLNVINSKISHDDLIEVDRVTTDVISDAIKGIRSNKNDPVFTFNSDCIKQAPNSLYQHIANMIKCFLIHGHVSNILLVATILPLLKDKMGDIESSDNYRSIALSSVILKIYDWVVMILCGDKLQLDELQFSYQKNCSTTMCTWLVVETVSHFARNGNDTYSCSMDMKKAFDLVKHDKLFKKLFDRKFPLVHLRLFIYMYMMQSAKVKWKGTLSDAFSIVNGVKQGAVISAILFCVYIDDMIKMLRKRRDGCWIDKTFVGIIIYADDIILLSPSLDGLQNMIHTCFEYATKHNLIFSTNDDPKKSKTKCIAFLRKERKLRILRLGDKSLPWVSSIKHLGSTITNNLDCMMDQDMLEKRAIYCAKNNELVQEFHFAHHKTKVWINNVFNTSFYSSPLWDLTSKCFRKLENSWNVSQRVILDLPRETHRFFIEPLSNTRHITKSLKKRFISFIDKVKRSEKFVLRHVLNKVEHDCLSTTGRNIRTLLLDNGTDNLSDINLDRTPYKEVSPQDNWKIMLVDEIIMAKSRDIIVPNFNFEELNAIKDFVCRM